MGAGVGQIDLVEKQPIRLLSLATEASIHLGIFSGPVRPRSWGELRPTACLSIRGLA